MSTDYDPIDLIFLSVSYSEGIAAERALSVEDTAMLILAATILHKLFIELIPADTGWPGCWAYEAAEAVGDRLAYSPDTDYAAIERIAREVIAGR